jgi:hypothetical protein
MSTAAPTALAEGQVLLAWLNLIGWRVHIQRDRDRLVGVATHCTSEATLRVRAGAHTHGELVGVLFEAAMRLLERHGSGRRQDLVEDPALGGASAA